MTPSATLRALLSGAIDYAGLFPPARLSMREAAERYQSYRQSADAWALGRFVVPAVRLPEFLEVRRSIQDGGAWRLSAILGAEAAGESLVIREFNSTYADVSRVDSAEMKVSVCASSVRDEIGAVVRVLPTATRVFAELALGGDMRALLEVMRAEHVNAKIRTGGVVRDSFPAPEELATFLALCAEMKLGFKATAGLHHACRGEYPLTYEPDAPRAAMFGFLNVLLAAIFARAGAARSEVIAILGIASQNEFHFGNDEIRWRDVRVSHAQLVEARQSFVLSFGSCSFEEPIQELRALSLL